MLRVRFSEGASWLGHDTTGCQFAKTLELRAWSYPGETEKPGANARLFMCVLSCLAAAMSAVVVAAAGTAPAAVRPTAARTAATGCRVPPSARARGGITASARARSGVPTP